MTGKVRDDRTYELDDDEDDEDEMRVNVNKDRKRGRHRALGLHPNPNSNANAPRGEGRKGKETLSVDELQMQPPPCHAVVLRNAKAQAVAQAVAHTRHHSPKEKTLPTAAVATNTAAAVDSTGAAGDGNTASRRGPRRFVWGGNKPAEGRENDSKVVHGGAGAGSGTGGERHRLVPIVVRPTRRCPSSATGDNHGTAASSSSSKSPCTHSSSLRTGTPTSCCWLHCGAMNEQPSSSTRKVSLARLMTTMIQDSSAKRREKQDMLRAFISTDYYRAADSSYVCTTHATMLNILFRFAKRALWQQDVNRGLGQTIFTLVDTFRPPVSTDGGRGAGLSDKDVRSMIARQLAKSNVPSGSVYSGSSTKSTAAASSSSSRHKAYADEEEEEEEEEEEDDESRLKSTVCLPARRRGRPPQR